MSTDETGPAEQIGAAVHPPAPSVLIVEDEPLIRMALADELLEENYRVLQAANAVEAKTYFRADEPIALVIADIDLPGMDGLAFANWVRGEFADVKIVLMSGDSKHLPAARQLGIFLAKPFPYRQLIQIAKDLCPAPQHAPTGDQAAGRVLDPQ
jgi:DNA-binding response OmpR family regulator